ncbi:DUF1761 domain-containing protein [Gaoshiqia sediminis]|uniref:DUF1761 domain-containing protein n=1 Tax=Gaoshiqia sediminis TaxID=2986998 RepID=A0AA42C6H9_9BACT|nr:DUF1761 domain-containing protein [Gaoshiqia sediminis]MCW0482539.1 DUF1761 domain-containing protein [Gaoshiqia sediminis]
MDLANVIEHLNFWAILVAALSTFVIGSLWYSPVMFGNRWMLLNGFNEKTINMGSLPLPVVFGSSFLMAVLAAFALALFLGTSANLGMGVFAGFVISVCWISTARINTVLYEKRSFSLFLINAGYDLVSYVLMGAIIGMWH